jgi:hypothetical protein
VDQDVLQRHRVRMSGRGERALLFAHGAGFRAAGVAADDLIA